MSETGSQHAGTTTDDDPVLYEVNADTHVATVTLNRPLRRNAISARMIGMLSDVLTSADEDRRVRVVLLTGAGRGFCAGLDLKAAADGTGLGGANAPGGSRISNVRTLPTMVLREIDTPVVAVINGAAAGYGLDLALGCDLRIMSRSARLVPAYARRGIVPESGGTWYLPRLVGWAKAAEIAYLGHDIDADEAQAIGLVNRAVDAEDVAEVGMDMATEVAAGAPLALRAIKRMFRFGETQDFGSHSHHVYVQMQELLGTADFREGISSFLEGRPPRFEGR